MFLLDTNVVSELRKRNADPRVRAWAEHQRGDELFLSAITVYELEIGVQRIERRDAQQGAALRRWLDEQVLPAFDGRILPVDAKTATRAGSVQVPEPRPERDCLIAATALVHSLTLVTRNCRDFHPMGVAMHNPWDAPTEPA